MREGSYRICVSILIPQPHMVRLKSISLEDDCGAILSMTSNIPLTLMDTDTI